MSSYTLYVRVPLLCVIATLMFMGIFARRGWFDWRRIVLQNEELSNKIQLSLLQKEDLERRTEALRTDRKAQERVVRQLFGYVRRDETVIEF